MQQHPVPQGGPGAEGAPLRLPELRPPGVLPSSARSASRVCRDPFGSLRSTELSCFLESDAVSKRSPQEVADNNCVYRNVVHHSAGEFTQVLQDVAGDPTLPRTKSVRCSSCGHGEAVFFQATARGEEGMTLFFVCCNPSCGNRWRE
uniref:TFIIS-type domain-containing protein n=1 Tax=Zea mays TaxID=4577 RepID=A0A804N5N9_MAIZE|eukprot:XP_008672955.1 uncharacterized protein LOC100284267 isoform X1 [Zea mays]